MGRLLQATINLTSKPSTIYIEAELAFFDMETN